MHQNRENQAPHQTRRENNPQHVRQPHIKHDTRRETRLQVRALQRLAFNIEEINKPAPSPYMVWCGLYCECLRAIHGYTHNLRVVA